MRHVSIPRSAVALLLLVALLFSLNACKQDTGNLSGESPGSTSDTPNIYLLLSDIFGLGDASGTGNIVAELKLPGSGFGEEYTQPFVFQVNAGLPLYRCVAVISPYGGSGYGTTEKLIITDALDNSPVQTIIPPAYNMEATTPAVYFIDVTFDGSLDILIPENSNSNAITLDAFVWDSSSRQFVEAPSFASIPSPTIDTGSKRILSFFAIGNPVNISTMYAYQDGRFVETNCLSWGWAIMNPDPVPDAENLIHFAETKGDRNLGNQETVADFYVQYDKDSSAWPPFDISDPRVAPYYQHDSFWDLSSPKWSGSSADWQGAF